MKALRSAPLLALVAAATFAAGCGSDDDSSSADTTAGGAAAAAPTPAAASSTASEAATTVSGTATTASEATSAMSEAGDAPAMSVAVDIGEFVFVPADVHVAVGGSVTWTNTHTQPHTATSSGTFDTGAIEPGASAEQTFDEPGTFDFICSFHPFMTGSVVVG